MTAQKRTLETVTPQPHDSLSETGHADVHGPFPLRHDESCTGVAVVARRQAASAQGGDGHGGRGAAAERHDDRERIQTPAEQPPVQRRVADRQEDHLSDFVPALGTGRGAAEARRRPGRAVLPEDFLRGAPALRGERAGSLQELRGGQSAVL